MSAKALISAANGSPDGSGAAIVRPQTTIGALAEQQRVQAEIHSRLMVAKSCPRDEVEAIDRIKNACQRVGLAEKSEYAYSRGGTEITGPTIDLLTVIANNWGNIDYGFRELSQSNKESQVEAFAWDLETNAKRTVMFTVPHKRYTKSGTYDLTDPRDIYEAVANYAQRRVRACLEAIIPPDVVEDAVYECRATLQEHADVTPDSIKKLVEAFSRAGVTKEQIEKRLGRRLDSMQPAQLIGLRRIFKSMKDGMSKAEDWFEPLTAVNTDKPQTAMEAAKEALRQHTAKPVEDTHDRPQTSDAPNPDLVDGVEMDLAEATTVGNCEDAKSKWLKHAKTPADETMVRGKCDAKANEIRAARGERSNKG